MNAPSFGPPVKYLYLTLISRISSIIFAENIEEFSAKIPLQMKGPSADSPWTSFSVRKLHPFAESSLKLTTADLWWYFRRKYKGIFGENSFVNRAGIFWTWLAPLIDSGAIHRGSNVLDMTLATLFDGKNLC